MSNQASEFRFNEKLDTTASPRQGQILELNVPRGLNERRIYLWLDTKTTAAGVVVIEGRIVGYLEGIVVMELPCNIAENNNVAQSQSKPCLVNSGGSPVGDSLVLYVAQQLDAAVANPTLQPLRINANLNKLVFVVDKVNDASGLLTGYHFAIACLSTRY